MMLIFSDTQEILNGAWKKWKTDNVLKMRRGNHCHACWHQGFAVRMEFVSCVRDRRNARSYAPEVMKCPRCGRTKKIYGEGSLERRGGSLTKNRY